MSLETESEQYLRRVAQAAIAGMDAAAPQLEASAEQRARAQMRGQTGATFAGIYAAVEGEGASSEGIVAEALAKVTDLNPAHAYTEAAPAPPLGVVRLRLSVPTDYISLIEATADRAFLADTGDAEGPSVQAAIEQALRAIV